MFSIRVEKRVLVNLFGIHEILLYFMFDFEPRWPIAFLPSRDLSSRDKLHTYIPINAVDVKIRYPFMMPLSQRKWHY